LDGFNYYLFNYFSIETKKNQFKLLLNRGHTHFFKLLLTFAFVLLCKQLYTSD